MKDWGFKYRTLAFCWSKHTKNGKKVSNLGRWTMGNVELCLLGVRGKPKRKIKNIKQLVEAERTKHSKKPEEVRNRIVKLMGDIPRIELFARQKTEGWDVWGNEVESDIELTSQENKQRMKKEIIKLLNKLLFLPIGEQIYAKEIKMLFELLEKEI